MEKNKLTFGYASSFLRDYKKLPSDLQEKVDEALKQIRNYLEAGTAPYGLRIKSLSPKIYEGRVDIHYRVVYFKVKNTVHFVCVGNHEDVKRTLKAISRF